MNPLLIEPTDVLFFRDSIPMSAGQGRGAGCRLPLPSTLHEALRASLLLANAPATGGKRAVGRPHGAPRSGLWKAEHGASAYIGTKAYQSLCTAGPFPWHEQHRLLLPTPLDANVGADGQAHPLVLLAEPPFPAGVRGLADYRPPCLVVATSPADKHVRTGWWTVSQWEQWLRGETSGLSPLGNELLWQPEHRIGLEIEPDRLAAKDGQLYAGTFLRPQAELRLAAWAGLRNPNVDEADQLKALDFLMLGGEQRLARLWRDELFEPPRLSLPDNNAGPCLLKWSLVSPAVFSHGWLPGWLSDSQGERMTGEVCLKLSGRAWLAAVCLGKPHAFAGWDLLANDGRGAAKPTQLAVPAGSTFWFLCESPDTRHELAKLLHWRPRSDCYGEKGFGYGLCAFPKHLHRTSADVCDLVNHLKTK